MMDNGLLMILIRVLIQLNYLLYSYYNLLILKRINYLLYEKSN